MKAVVVWSVLIFTLLVASFSVRAVLKFRASPLSGLSRVTLVYLDKNYQPLLLSLEGRSGLLMTMPVTDKVQVPFGFGEYELGKVYQLGELDHRGGQLLVQTLQRNTPAAVFDYILDPNASINDILSSPENFFRNIFWKTYKGNGLKTNLSKFDLLILTFRVRKLDSGLFKVKVYQGDPQENFQDSQLRKESFSVEVLNATEHSGLAQTEADFLQKNGLRVVRVSDALEKQEKSRITFNNDQIKDSYTANWFKLIYDYPVEKSGNENRADITVILGEDYWKMLSEKW